MNIKGKPLKEQQALTWAIARKVRVFTAYRLASLTGANWDAMRKYCAEWEADKRIERIGVGPRRRTVYRVLGDLMDRQAKTPTQAMWDTARFLGRFNLQGLRIQASTEAVQVTEKQAREFVTMLLNAEYLRVLRKAVPGVQDAEYLLIRNSGPVAPEIKRVRCLWDPNIQDYTYVPEPHA